MRINDIRIDLYSIPDLAGISMTDVVILKFSAVDIGVICDVAPGALSEYLVALISALSQSG